MNALGSAMAMTLFERMRRVAAIAATHADAVDIEARFPREAVDAMR
jgi:acyl-CoA dehydrogenase